MLKGVAAMALARRDGHQPKTWSNLPSARHLSRQSAIETIPTLE